MADKYSFTFHPISNIVLLWYYLTTKVHYGCHEGTQRLKCIFLCVTLCCTLCSFVVKNLTGLDFKQAMIDYKVTENSSNTLIFFYL